MDKKLVKKCVGCGHIYGQPLGLNNNGEPFKSCCPDSSFVDSDVVDANEYIDLLNQYNHIYGLMEKINVVMWESYCIDIRNFGKKEGTEIMNLLEEWATKH